MNESVFVGVLGILLGALATGLLKAWSDRVDRGNKWLEFKRGNARGFMQHIAVHGGDGKVGEEDERLIGHYYTLALAVSDDQGAVALYEALPEHLQSQVHDPGESLFNHLRSEVTPGRKGLGRPLAPPGKPTA
jgi:hypothetical protein